MGRAPCYPKDQGLNRGTWTIEEDQILTSYIKVHGPRRWSKIPKEAGLRRCGKSCRLRWLNYLRPDIKRGNITPEEEDLIIRLHNLLGNRWSLIARRLPGRTDNDIKNYWNAVLKKKLAREEESDRAHLLETGTSSWFGEKVEQHGTEGNVIWDKADRCSRVLSETQVDGGEVQLKGNEVEEEDTIGSDSWAVLDDFIVFNEGMEEEWIGSGSLD